MARHTASETVFEANRTLPSPIITITPPRWLLFADTCIAMFVIVPGNGMPAHERVLGVDTWL